MTNKKPSEQTPESHADFIVSQFLEHGFSLSSPQQVDFSLHFPDRGDAAAAAEELRAGKFMTEIRPIQGGKIWGCLVYLTLMPEKTRLAKIIRRFQTLAISHNGEYGGCEIEVPSSSGSKHLN